MTKHMKLAAVIGCLLLFTNSALAGSINLQNVQLRLASNLREQIRDKSIPVEVRSSTIKMTTVDGVFNALYNSVGQFPRLITGDQNQIQRTGHFFVEVGGSTLLMSCKVTNFLRSRIMQISTCTCTNGAGDVVQREFEQVFDSNLCDPDLKYFFAGNKDAVLIPFSQVYQE